MRENELNLIPVDIIRHENLKQRSKLWVHIAIGVLMSLFFMNILVKVMNSSISGSVVDMRARSEKVSRGMVEIGQLDVREKELLDIREKIHYLSGKGPVIEIFTAIDRAINENISLTHLEVKYNFISKAGAGRGGGDRKGYFNSAIPPDASRRQAAEGNRVLLQGIASTNVDIASMLALLSRSPLFESVDLKYSKTGASEKNASVMFEIECRLSDKMYQ